MNEHNRRRVRCAVASFAVLVTTIGCGDSGNGDTRSETSPGEQVTAADDTGAASSAPAPIAVATAIVELHGPDAGVAATLYALDAGYSVDQLTAAALDGTLVSDGSIADVTPAEPHRGVIAAPIEGLRRSTDAPERTPEDVQREIEQKLTTVASIRWLGAPLGVAGDISYADVFERRTATTEPAEQQLDPAAKEAAAATIGVIIALVDTGYSLEQVINGFVFGETALAIGVDRSGEENPGLVVLDDAPVAACFTLRDASGQVIMPAGVASNVLLASAPCARAIRAGTISFDGLDRLRPATTVEPVAEPTTAPAAGDPDVDGPSYGLSAVIEYTEAGGTVRYDWDGRFVVADDGSITGAGAVVGTAAGTCESPGLEGTVRATYAYTVEGAYDIAGRSADGQLEIRLTDNTAALTAEQGDTAILCVDLSRDLTLAFGLLSLGDPSLGPIELPATGGSTAVDLEGIVVEVTVTAS